MRVGNIFTKIAKSKVGQKIYKHLLDPKHEKVCNIYLPILESAAISSFYIASTAIQKNIDPESKKAMQIQNILSFITSVGLSIPMNKGISKLGDKIVKGLKPELMKDGHKVIDGVKVGLPLINSLIVSRFLIAVALVPLSSKIRDYIKNKKGKKLDVKA